MKVVGVTGGIATGKTTFNRRLITRTGAELFDSDACSRLLLNRDIDVAAELRVAFGKEVFDGDGKPDRVAFRELVFRDDAARSRLETIIHPRVRAAWQERVRFARESQQLKLLVVDLPLLYEVGAELEFDLVVVVACYRDLQIARLENDRGLSRRMAEAIVEKQLPLTEKIRRSDLVVWNGGRLDGLHAQADLVGEFLVN